MTHNRPELRHTTEAAVPAEILMFLSRGHQKWPKEHWGIMNDNPQRANVVLVHGSFVDSRFVYLSQPAAVADLIKEAARG